MTHLPYRSWCRHCVRGRGKSAAHYQQEADQKHSIPHVSFDYVFLGKENEKTFPIIHIHDHASKVTFSHAVPCKGTAGSPYPAKQVAYSTSRLGHNKLIFRSDKEPALLDVKMDVCRMLRKECGMTVTGEESPVEDHQANAVVERANGEFGGMARTLNDQLIQNY